MRYGLAKKVAFFTTENKMDSNSLSEMSKGGLRKINFSIFQCLFAISVNQPGRKIEQILQNTVNTLNVNKLQK